MELFVPLGISMKWLRGTMREAFGIRIRLAPHTIRYQADLYVLPHPVTSSLGVVSPLCSCLCPCVFVSLWRGGNQGTRPLPDMEIEQQCLEEESRALEGLSWRDRLVSILPVWVNWGLAV